MDIVGSTLFLSFGLLVFLLGVFLVLLSGMIGFFLDRIDPEWYPQDESQQKLVCFFVAFFLEVFLLALYGFIVA